MILALDAGNSNLVMGGLEDGRILFTARIATDRAKTEDEYAVLMQSILEMHHQDPAEIQGSILSSVVPPLNQVLLRAAELVTGRRPLLVGPGMETGLTFQVDNPSGLGSDRIVDAVAASTLYPLPVIIIDMGTATTVSVVDEDRTFRGGIICAGIRISQEALASRTSQLPAISLDPPCKAIGRNTIDCMKSGAIFGNAAMVDGLAARIEAELGRPATVVATGGMGKRIIPSCRRRIQYDPDLLLKGLWLLYQKNCGEGQA